MSKHKGSVGHRIKRITVRIILVWLGILLFSFLPVLFSAMMVER